MVIGAGIAGLTAAQVLSERFSSVTVLDRDTLPDDAAPRRGVPQSSQPHILLAAGMRELNALFPGLEDDLIAAGAVRFDPGLGLGTFRYGRRWPAFPTGVDLVSVSRPQLEALIRARVAALPGVAIRDQVAVSALTAGVPSAAAGQVTGVVLDSGETLTAKLVVDCTGRGSRSDRWLAALGLPAPAQIEVKVGVTYTSRLYRRKPDDLPGWQAAFTLPTPPAERMTGVAVPIEGDRWLVSIGGWHLPEPPATAEALEARIRELPDTLIAGLIDGAEPLGDVVMTRFPASRRRLFEKLAEPPAGYLAIGDAICSFNPIYGQGMTCAAREATALGAVLDAHDREPGTAMARDFYTAAAEVVETPWQFAVGGDFTFPETTGHRPRGQSLRNWYARQIGLASQIDPEINRVFSQVQHLLMPPGILREPSFVARVLRQARRRSHGAAPAASATGSIAAS